MKSRRALHFLIAKLALDGLAVNGRLPSSRSLAIATGKHPATARRWRADLRAVLGLKAHNLPEIIKPRTQKERSPDCANSRGLITQEPLPGNSDEQSI